MFSPLSVLLTVLVYMGLLFILAQWVEHRISTGKSRFSSPWIYALSQAVFFTSWTFYGSVGFAAERGLQFFAIYIGAILGMLLSGVTFLRMVRAKEAFRITSVADFISTRYNHSQLVAALATLVALAGVTPYIALQLKAIVGSLSVITPATHEGADWNLSGTLVTMLMILFTIVFGVRRLDPTERHQGMIAALVAECVLKLIAFLTLGIFISYFLFDGPSDILIKIGEQDLGALFSLSARPHAGTEWLTLIILGFAAIHCLPRQFHVAVVENSSRHHWRVLLWTFPLYTLAISLFVVPITGAGLLLGLPADQGDQFMLLIPQIVGSPAMTLLAFLGGFAAATGMIIITTMTLATMASNHLLLPVCERIRPLSGLRSWMLQVRWLLVCLILIGAYWTGRILDDSYILVSIGLISFAAVLQFAPPMLIGLFWRRGNSRGALLGLSLGFTAWFYTLIIPAWVEEGWLAPAILNNGLLGIQALRPEQLFGLETLPALSHSVFWSLTFNVSGYLLGSLLFRARKNERRLTRELLACMRGNPLFKQARPTGLDAYITLPAKLEEALEILQRYLQPSKASAALGQVCEDLQISGKHRITIIELMELHRMLEHLLAGSIGAAAAHTAVGEAVHYSERETADLKALYSHLVYEMPSDDETEQASSKPRRGSEMVAHLQHQVEQLERKNREQATALERLKTRLDKQYAYNFELRVKVQNLRVERDDLKERMERTGD
ncbi:MAG: hypothetical protein CMI01_10190 [Oceanospirillaceae bacterium]|nr:hypothetical protein [Oceanospirillaceae bacterium]